jgi:hypothetical protein
MREPRAVFVALSPYHVFLALGLAWKQRRRGPAADLILVKEFAGAGALIRILGDWADSPFAEILPLPASNRSDWSLPRRLLQARSNARRVRRWVERRDPGAVHVFNDARPESQAALAAAGPGALRIAVEDGTAFYGENRFPQHHGLLAKGLRRLLYGKAWRAFERIGEHPELDEILALFPDQITESLRTGRHVTGLDPTPFEDPALREPAERWLQSFGLEVETVADLDTLVLPAHSELMPDPQGYRDMLRQACRDAVDRGHRVGLKLHPREEGDPYGTAEFSGIQPLPHGMAVEFLLLLTPNLRSVVGGASTALLTTRRLRPTVPVVCLDPRGAAFSRRLMETFAALGIQRD